MKKLCLILSLNACYEVYSTPTGLGSLAYDKLDTDISKLRYESDDKIDWSKLLNDIGLNKESKTTVTSGFKKKNTASKGIQSKQDIGDIKKFVKTVGADDKGAYNNNDIYAIAKAIVGKAIGIEGSENRTYKKGSKTTGFHKIHNKDEFKKDKTFYEDDEINGSINKVGAKALGSKFGAGGAFNHGAYHHDQQKGVFGKQADSDTGFFDKEFNEFSDSQGINGFFNN